MIDRSLRTHFDRILGIYLGNSPHTIRTGYNVRMHFGKIRTPHMFRILDKTYTQLGIPHTPVRRLGI